MTMPELTKAYQTFTGLFNLNCTSMITDNNIKDMIDLIE